MLVLCGVTEVFWQFNTRSKEEFIEISRDKSNKVRSIQAIKFDCIIKVIHRQYIIGNRDREQDNVILAIDFN